MRASAVIGGLAPRGLRLDDLDLLAENVVFDGGYGGAFNPAQAIFPGVLGAAGLACLATGAALFARVRLARRPSRRRQ